jgi:tRNA dimethylallyltransferase
MIRAPFPRTIDSIKGIAEHVRNQQPNLLVIVQGPTASGKTALALRLAQEYGWPIVNADSRQLYRGMDIGTGKPTAQERSLAPHFQFDVAEPHESYSAGRYERETLAQLRLLFAHHPVVLLVGGTGFYIRALVKGLPSTPPPDPIIRAQVTAELQLEGLQPLLAELQAKDPQAFQAIDRQNPARVQRAVEVIRQTGAPFSSFQKAAPARRDFSTLKFAVEWDREELYYRINRRVETMLADGWVAETQALLDAGFAPDCPGMTAIGYREVVAHLQGRLSEAELCAAIQQETRQFAKRQLTWFRAEGDTRWVEPHEYDRVAEQIALARVG